MIYSKENLYTPGAEHPGVYAIYCASTESEYIGETGGPIIDRWHRHVRKLYNNKHHNPRLQADWNRYGLRRFNFLLLETVLGEVGDPDWTTRLFTAERTWILSRHTYPWERLYNEQLRVIAAPRQRRRPEHSAAHSGDRGDRDGPYCIHVR